MECEKNIPPFRNSWRTDYEIGSLLSVEPVEEKYYRIAKQMAAFYKITLCDAAEAQLIGAYANQFAFQPRAWSELYIPIYDDVFDREMPGPKDFERDFHVRFLRDYLQLHGLTYHEIDKKLHILFVDTKVGPIRGLYEDFQIDENDVVAEIHKLTAQYSVPTKIDVPAVQASEGGTIIRGGTFDFPTCKPPDAKKFRALAMKRSNGHWSKAANGTASGGIPLKRNDRYQVNKCGRREYALRTDANAQSHKPLADGLTPTKPPKAKSGYGSACCILEAKYVGSPKLTPYQKRRDFLRNAKVSKYLPKRLKGLSRAMLIASWETVRANQAVQFGLYLGAIADPDIPYWNVQYICSRNSCRDYFRSIIRLALAPKFIAKACTSSARKRSENWIT